MTPSKESSHYATILVSDVVLEILDAPMLTGDQVKFIEQVYLRCRDRIARESGTAFNDNKEPNNAA